MNLRKIIAPNLPPIGDNWNFYHLSMKKSLSTCFALINHIFIQLYIILHNIKWFYIFKYIYIYMNVGGILK